MSVLRNLRRLAFHLTPREESCLEFYDCCQREKLRSVSSARTRIPTQHLRPEFLSPSRQELDQVLFRSPSATSSKNTWPTSNTHFRMVATSLDGCFRASFCGTRSQLADQVHLFLMTGREKSGHLSRERSLESFQEEVSY